MRRMKSRFRYLAAALLALTTASLGAGAQDKPRELTYWTPYTGGDGEYFERMVKTFNALQDEVVMRASSQKFASYYVKLSEALAAGTGPDVFIVTRDRVLDYERQGALAPLDDLLKKERIERSAFLDDCLSNYSVGGKTYAVPWGIHPIIMYYNKRLFAKAGIVGPPSTLAELVADAKAIQAKTGAIGVAADNTTSKYKAYTLARLFLSFLKQQGKEVLAPGNSRAAVAGAAGERAYAALADMVNKYRIAPKGLDYDLSVEYFGRGQAGIHFNGSWVTGLFEAQEGLDFGAVELPPFLGSRASWCSSDAFALPARKDGDESKAALAMKFIDWMTGHGELWAKAGHMPARKSVYAKRDFLDLPRVAEYANAVRDSFEPPATPKWSLCYAAIADSLELSISLGEAPRAALARMEGTIDAILGK